MIELVGYFTQNYISCFHPLLSTPYSQLLLDLSIFRSWNFSYSHLAFFFFFFAYAVYSAWNILSHPLKHSHSLANTFMHLSFNHPLIHLKFEYNPVPLCVQVCVGREYSLEQDTHGSVTPGIYSPAERFFPSCSSQLCPCWRESVSLITLTLRRKGINSHRLSFVCLID